MRLSFLKTNNLFIGYTKGLPLISNINASLSDGEVVSLLGANGSGKSTLLKTLSGEIMPLSGEVILKDKNLKKTSKKEISRLLSLVSTDHTMAGGLTVTELIGLGRHPYTGIFGTLSKNDKAIIEKAMSRVRISHKRNEYVSNLSDGERQKVFIGRALAQDTPILLLDEPFSFLDAAARIEIFSILKCIAVDEKKSILLSTHDISQALRMADRLWIIDKEGRFNDITPDKAILSGIMDNIYDSKDVKFSSNIGDFTNK